MCRRKRLQTIYNIRKEKELLKLAGKTIIGVASVYFIFKGKALKF